MHFWRESEKEIIIQLQGLNLGLMTQRNWTACITFIFTLRSEHMLKFQIYVLSLFYVQRKVAEYLLW
jgi:hypothetical protein